MPRSNRDGYHHGDARNALIAAATELVERVGARDLSLRGVAARAGLSRQAPYNHFADKEALLAELVRAGFQRLQQDVRATRGYPTAAASLARAGEAYIAFAQRSPAVFRLMFSRELVDLSRFPDAAQAADAAFQSLVEIVATFAPPSRVADVALAAWCIVHGYATLCIEVGLEDGRARARRARAFARIIRADALQAGRR